MFALHINFPALFDIADLTCLLDRISRSFRFRELKRSFPFGIMGSPFNTIPSLSGATELYSFWANDSRFKEVLDAPNPKLSIISGLLSYKP